MKQIIIDEYALSLLDKQYLTDRNHINNPVKILVVTNDKLDIYYVTNKYALELIKQTKEYHIIK